MLHVQIRNEATLLQQQLVSLEANLGQCSALEKVLNSLSCLDFIDQNQTDQCLQDMQLGLKALSLQIKQTNPTLLIINSLNDLTRSFQRLRSLYLTHRLQLFREKVSGAAPLQQNPALKAEENFHLNLRRLDGQVSSELRKMHQGIESALTHVFQQLQKANPPEIDAALFCEEELQTLTRLSQITSQIEQQQSRIDAKPTEALDGISRKIAEIQQEFTAVFKQSLAQAAQIQSAPVSQPTPPPASSLKDIQDDLDHTNRAVGLTIAQIHANMEQHQPTPLAMLVGVRAPAPQQNDMARHLAQKLSAEIEEKLERIIRLEAAVQKAQKDMEVNRLALERGNRQLVGAGLAPVSLESL